MTTKDVITAFHDNARHADFVGKAVVKEPVSQADDVACAVSADAPVKVPRFVTDTDHEARGAVAKFSRRVCMTDVETFNQFCVEYGWLELLVESGDDRVPSVADVEFFHKRFGGSNKRDALETLSCLYKYISKAGFDGVPAPADWLMKVHEYIARLKAGSTAAATNS
ncbi:hypothetical protein [Burkholderia thailandensis]|uniref:hypothetical protein n=1 Tax=Burkholderia thailandensis TaxID=57975 RepID=UPI0011AF821D|nr:hypothetical protein [Burkholderia thailandensis]